MERSSSCKLLKTVTWSLLIAVTLQVITLSNCQSSESGSVLLLPCIDCAPGEECTRKDDGTSYCKRICTQDCSEEDESVLCGSDGVTYTNLCELKKAGCEQNKNLNVEYEEACIAPPSPSEPLCKREQYIYDDRSFGEYLEICDFIGTRQKANNGSLKIEDVLACHRPNCEEGKYKTRQCSDIAYNWCWCTSPEGVLRNGSLEKNMPVDGCAEKAECEYDGKKYNDGDEFQPMSQCGFCQCSDSKVVCYEDFVPNGTLTDANGTYTGTNGTLSEDQLTQFQDEILKVYYIQYVHKADVLVNIKHIAQYPARITDSLKSKTLRWKFGKYDKNKDGVLSAPEQFMIRMDFISFVGCGLFLDQVSNMLDPNYDTKISRQEWTGFFAEDLLEYASTSGSTSSEGSSVISARLGKRSIDSEQGFILIGRKPMNLRKKFYYTFI